MHEIICPHCRKAFKIDEAGYADIVKQVRDDEFAQQLRDRLELAEQEKKTAIALAQTQADLELQRVAALKDTEIQGLKATLENGEVAKQLAVNEALSALEKDRNDLANKLDQANNDKKAAAELANAKLDGERQKITAEKDKEIAQLTLTLSGIEDKQRLAETVLKNSHEKDIKVLNDEVKRIQDMKARLSTKMIGETLEQHCEAEFGSIRATAFPEAIFKKDNDIRTGSKGDFIFRDRKAGIEIVSIMFEMKNESDYTESKKRNEDFLKELDKDRIEKGCEYAILVSLLERDSALYDTGIVDVSHLYPKMYVIRPQFFIPIITLLRNAAMNALEFKSELALVRAQSIDITNFETELETVRAGFAMNRERAATHFKKAIAEIDKSIEHLEKTREALTGTDNNLRLMNNKVQSLTIRKLTKNSPTIAAKFAETSRDRPLEDLDPLTPPSDDA